MYPNRVIVRNRQNELGDEQWYPAIRRHLFHLVKVQVLFWQRQWQQQQQRQPILALSAMNRQATWTMRPSWMRWSSIKRFCR